MQHPYLPQKELIKIKEKHAEEAFAYMREYGKEMGGVWHEQSGRQTQDAVLDRDERAYSSPQAARLAYLFALKERGEIDETPPFPRARKLEWVSNIRGGLENTPPQQIWKMLRYRRISVKDVMAKSKDEIDAVFLNIKQKYRPGMAGRELYEIARTNWPISAERRDDVRYALAVAHGKVHGIYHIHKWEPVGKRWQFIGESADDLWERCVRKRYRMTYSVKYGNLEKFMNSENLEKGEQNGMTKNEILQLLCQFGQIVFYGPPGTGKTYSAMEMLGELFGADKWESLQGDRWDIVQFHPSYNYEDFVRGVQVKTGDDKKVAYETVNRIFGEMCERAAESGEPHVLIIDEINRANVSAVLGELIYALEYRGKAVKTPYLGNIVIPKNLYIIGTMNTADRTIGQIDYAVRRRFAFVHIAPDETVITNADAQEFFADVDTLFNDSQYMSGDFDAEDVRIGHSYFLADGAELGNKIIYQVVPILREYVRDGVLLPESEKVIKGIKERAEELAKKPPPDESESDSPADDEDETGGKQYFYWRNGDRSDISVRQRAGFLIARDFIREKIKKNSDINLEALKEAFAPDGRGSLSKIFRLQSDAVNYKNRYYDKEPVQLPNGEKICISSGWHDGHKNKWNDFRAKAKEYGYSIGQCHLVNVGENDGNDPRARSWDDCHKHGFVSGRGVGYKASIEKIKKGDFVFVRIAEAQEGKNGFIACAEVLEEAVHIAEFRTAEDGLLADYDVGGGQTYREKYPNAFAEDYPDYAVRVKWLPGIKSRNDTVQISSAVRKLRVGKINQNDFAKLRNAFDLPGFDK